MGIELEFRDARGEIVRASRETQRRLLAAMGVDAADEGAATAALEVLDRAEWERALPPVVVLRSQDDPPSVELTLRAGTGEISWHVQLEDGGERSGRTEFAKLALVSQFSLGNDVQRRRWCWNPPSPAATTP
jgi:hypothetical protein